MPMPSDHSAAYEFSCRLPRRRSSVPRARAALSAALGAWGAGKDVAETAELVLSELVTNALRVRVPRDRQVGVRIARTTRPRGRCGSKSAMRARAGRKCGCRGTTRRAAAGCCSWRRWRTGGACGTAWAGSARRCGRSSRPPVSRPAPAGREVAAVTVRPGQAVRAWGAWHTIRSVRVEQLASGDLTIVLGLDEGPALRLHASEPLIVREGAAEGSPS
jgi:hypothetical protein